MADVKKCDRCRNFYMTDDMVEEWKDIPGYEGLYAVSNLGNIKSFRKTEKLLKPVPIKSGHLIVNLSKNGNMRTVCVHRLVAEAYIPNPNMFTIVIHKDGNKQNNSASNLKWCDARCGYGYKKPKVVVQLDLDNNIINKFHSVNKAAQITGIARESISRTCNGIRKTAGGYKWKYEKAEGIE